MKRNGNTVDSAELEILTVLDSLVRDKDVGREIDKIVAQVQSTLDADKKADMAWEPIPLNVYGENLPGDIHSSWVLILRADTITGAERHPNSHQRMMAYHGNGDY